MSPSADQIGASLHQRLARSLPERARARVDTRQNPPLGRGVELVDIGGGWPQRPIHNLDAMEAAMSYYDSDPRTRRFAGPDVAAIDAGLRAHMLRVYNYMAGGLAVTGLVAYGS